MSGAAPGQGTISVGYLIESLGSGGAERQLVALIRHLDRDRFAARVMSYVEDDFFRAELEEMRVPVQCLRRASRLDPRPVLAAAGWLASGAVDLLHSYLRTPNLYATLARRLARRGRVVVSERSSLLRDRGLVRWHGPWSFRAADLVVANSEAARRELVTRLALPEHKTAFVPNSVDLTRFAPVDRAGRAALRRQLGWDERRRVLLTVASFGEAKGHLGLVEALAGLDLDRGDLLACWAGAPEPHAGYQRVVERARRLGVLEAVELLGRRGDVVDLYRAADLLVLPSLWEGTPNVVLEALACGCPVVATDVSDTARYVLPGRSGWLVEPGSAGALRDALAQAVRTPEPRLREMGEAGRAHVEGLGITPEAVARRYEQLYLRLCAPGGGPGAPAEAGAYVGPHDP